VSETLTVSVSETLTAMLYWFLEVAFTVLGGDDSPGPDNFQKMSMKLQLTP